MAEERGLDVISHLSLSLSLSPRPRYTYINPAPSNSAGQEGLSVDDNGRLLVLTVEPDV
jgi:hypothetical protein